MAESLWDKLKAFDWGSTDTARFLRGAGDAAWSGFTAPRDAIQGTLDPSSPEGRQRALATALMMLGPSPAAGMGKGIAGAAAGRELAQQDAQFMGAPHPDFMPLYDQPVGAAMPQGIQPYSLQQSSMGRAANDRAPPLRLVPSAWDLSGKL